MKKKLILVGFISAMVTCIALAMTGDIYLLYGVMLIVPVLAGLFHEYY